MKATGDTTKVCDPWWQAASATRDHQYWMVETQLANMVNACLAKSEFGLPSRRLKNFSHSFEKHLKWMWHLKYFCETDMWKIQHLEFRPLGLKWRHANSCPLHAFARGRLPRLEGGGGLARRQVARTVAGAVVRQSPPAHSLPSCLCTPPS